MNKLFKEKIENYDLLQLEHWIRRCRTAVKKEDFLDTNKPKEDCEEDYKKAVLDFVEKWKEHYKDNETVYKKEDFKKAILGNGINLDRIVLALKKDRKTEKIDITEILYNRYLNNENLGIFNNLMDDYTNSRLKEIDKYFDLISDLDYIEDYKEKVAELIRNKIKYNIQTLTATVDDESILKIDDIEELLDALITNINQDLKILEKVGKEFPLLSSLKEFDVTKQTFYDFEDEANDGTYEKNYEKKFFINVGFYLSLNFELFEMFLSLFGYTIEKSRTNRDRILTEFIDIGFSKEYIDISIEANNLSPLTPRVAGYQKRDLNLIDKFLNQSSYTVEEIKEFKITLQYGITKLRNFIINKEEILRRAINKRAYIEILYKDSETQYINSDNEFELFEYENIDNEKNYRNKISNNMKKIHQLKVKGKEENKDKIIELTQENEKLKEMLNVIEPKMKELKKAKNDDLRLFERTNQRFKKINEKINNIVSEKYKSINIFDEHIEQYNNLTLDDIKNLLSEFEELYNKDFIP
ncbi:hypothetical protein [Tissierella praeacuta]|uniref:hypothetical protein n=1 Tax=Tissierella praeacuta TaxID=43131 RepID=UPI0033425939